MKLALQGLAFFLLWCVRLPLGAVLGCIAALELCMDLLGDGKWKPVWRVAQLRDDKETYYV